MTVNLFNRTLNNEISSVQALVSWINEQEKERLWQTIETLSSNPELAQAVYADDVKNVMEFAQISLRQINETSISNVNTELTGVLIIVIICSVFVIALVALIAGFTGSRITRSIKKNSENTATSSDSNISNIASIKNINEEKHHINYLDNKVLLRIKKMRDAEKKNEIIQHR